MLSCYNSLMDKALIILSDNNKGKFTSKGFSAAFKELSYFVIEKKIYDLNLSEISKIQPDIIFIFWTDMTQKGTLETFLSNYKNEKTTFIHCAEFAADIPLNYKTLDSHYVFACDLPQKKNRYLASVNPKDYKTKFNGYNYNITFSGNPSYKNREIILSKLVRNFGTVNIFARSYDFYKSVDDIYKCRLLDDFFMEAYRASYRGYVDSTSELAQIYASSKINIDIENEIPKSISYRCLEIMASGGFVIAPNNKELVKRFEDGKELETYVNDDDLADKIKFYMKNLNIAQLIALNGKRAAVGNCSFYDRLKTMLKVIYGKDISN